MTNPRVLGICPYHLPDFIAQARDCFADQTYHNLDWIDWDTSNVKLPIGSIRNEIIRRYTKGFEVVVHFDHDDWSCRTRVEEQVAFLLESQAAIVGYRDMPFYDEQRDRVTFYAGRDPHYALGTSMMYWRKTWLEHPFIERIGDEDGAMQRDVGKRLVATQSSVADGRLRMVARIHARNTSPKVGSRYEKADAGLASAVYSCLFPANVAQ